MDLVAERARDRIGSSSARSTSSRREGKAISHTFFRSPFDPISEKETERP